jgi:predicted transcriptional regulator
MKVVELMNKDVVTCHPTEKLNIILNKLELFNIAGMPVVDKGRLVGIVCQSDILRGLKNGTMAELAVSDVMTTDVVTVPPTESAVLVARIMVEKNINRVPIIENDKVVASSPAATSSMPWRSAGKQLSQVSGFRSQVFEDVKPGRRDAWTRRRFQFQADTTEVEARPGRYQEVVSDTCWNVLVTVWTAKACPGLPTWTFDL